ncbi:hypothetical protein SFRURICE_016203 [Spodoptera frugiperda]|nr:hypothetical protein SFRURICE_016203 [Spodoptera frugiperda]
MMKEVMTEKFKIFEERIISEFKRSLSSLAHENSKLREELRVANSKCISLSEEIKVLKINSGKPLHVANGTKQGTNYNENIAIERNPPPQPPRAPPAPRSSYAVPTAPYHTQHVDCAPLPMLPSQPAQVPTGHTCFEVRASNPTHLPARRIILSHHVLFYKLLIDLFVSLYFHLKSRFLFACCVVYIPPNCDESEYMLLFKLLEQICVRYKSNVVILGDFNMFSCNNNVKNYFEYFVAFSELVQWNNVPNCSGRQLDLVLSGRSYMEVCAAEEGLQPVDAYHPPLAVAVDVATYAQFSPIPAEDDLAHAQYPQLFNPYKRWNFHKVDFNYLYYSIGRINWKDIYSLQVPEEALDFYYSKMNEVFDDCVPIKKHYIRNNRYNYPVWYTADIIRDIKTKYILHKKYKASKTSSDYEQFSRYRAKVKMETELAHNRYRDRVQNHLANDPKAFWSYIRLKKGNSSQYKILKDDGQVLSGGECAEEYARYFQTVYNTEPPTLSAEAASSTTSPSSGGAKHIMDVCKKAYRNLGFILRQANQFTNIAAVKALYEALVKSHLEYNAGVWSPHENKYKLMIERIQNKFTRFVYLKLYGVYPGYPLLYPTLFVLGMVGYYKLEVRREVALATYLFKVLRGKTHNPALLEELRLCVPDEYVWRRRRPRLLVVPCARTNLLQKAPLTRALRTLNTIADRMDLFSCTLNEFTRVTYEVVKFLRSVNYKCNKPRATYEQLLKQFNMISLESRRLLLEVMTLHGLCNNKFDCTSLTNQLCYVVPRTVCRREVRLPRLFHTGTSRTNAGIRAPLRRLVDTYNSHFMDIDIFALSNMQFKRQVVKSLTETV